MVETHRERFLKRHKLPLNTSLSLEEISKLSGVPLTALQEVYNRGTGAYTSNLASVRLLKDFSKNPDTKKYPASQRLSKEAWSFARVYSFVDKGTTFKTTDRDIAKEYKLI
jgi:hypothetical protein